MYKQQIFGNRIQSILAAAVRLANFYRSLPKTFFFFLISHSISVSLLYYSCQEIPSLLIIQSGLFKINISWILKFWSVVYIIQLSKPFREFTRQSIFLIRLFFRSAFHFLFPSSSRFLIRDFCCSSFPVKSANFGITYC